eukprot:474187-Prymnesium_polylepis.1
MYSQITTGKVYYFGGATCRGELRGGSRQAVRRGVYSHRAQRECWRLHRLSVSLCHGTISIAPA